MLQIYITTDTSSYKYVYIQNRYRHSTKHFIIALFIHQRI